MNVAQPPRPPRRREDGFEWEGAEAGCLVCPAGLAKVRKFPDIYFLEIFPEIFRKNFGKNGKIGKLLDLAY